MTVYRVGRVSKLVFRDQCWLWIYLLPCYRALMMLSNALIRFSNIRCEEIGNRGKITRTYREEQQKVQFDKMPGTNASLA